MRWCISVLHTHSINRLHCMQTLISGWNVLLLNDLICILTGWRLCYTNILLGYFPQTFLPWSSQAVYFEQWGLMHISAVNSSANILQWKCHTTRTNLIIFHINNSYSNRRSLRPRMAGHRCLMWIVESSEPSHSFCQQIFIEQLLCSRRCTVCTYF